MNDLFDLDGKLPLGEVRALLLLLLGDSAGVLGAQSAADGTGLLCAEIEWEILLLCVEDAELMALVGVDDGEGSCDGFAEVVSVFSMIVSLLFFLIALRFYASLPIALCLSFFLSLSHFAGLMAGGMDFTHTFSSISMRHHRRSSGHGVGPTRS